MAYWLLLLHNLSNCTVTVVLSQHKDRLVLDFDEFATPLFFPCESVKWIQTVAHTNAVVADRCYTESCWL